jgi:hypothetical protein
MPEKYNVDSSLIWSPKPKEKTTEKLIEYLEKYGDLLDKFIIKNRPGWEKAFKKSSYLPLVGTVIMDIAKWLHVNPDFILALMIHESGGGTSPIAKDKNNFFGWMAYDKSPYSSAGYFCSAQGCIAYVVFRVRTLYFLETGTYFKGATLRGLNKNYSTDKEEPGDPLTWGDKVCLGMNKIDRFLTENNLT